MPSLTALRAYDRYLGIRTFASLDGVRALCILATIWHHSGPVTRIDFFQRGFLGVDMFFVLSGFLIVTLLLRERDRTGGISLKKFYARRALRIFPIYYLLIFGMLFFYLAIKPGTPGARSYLAAFPFLVLYVSNWVAVPGNNLAILWSLATEEQFYLGWPLVEKLARPVGVALILAGVLLVNQMINFGVLDPLFTWLYGGQVRLAILDVTFTPIALGVLLAHLLHAPGTFSRLFAVMGHRFSSLIAGTLLLALVALWPTDLSGPGRLSVQLGMMLVLGTLVAREDHWLRPVLSFRPLAYLGTISYGVYLYHMWAMHPVRLVFVKLGWPVGSVLFFLCTVVISTIVAGLSFRFIEQPLLKLKARFATEDKPHRADPQLTGRMAETSA